MNVEIQANQCREDKVRFFPVLDFSVLLAVLVGRKKKKKSYSQTTLLSSTSLPPFPSVISVARRNSTITKCLYDLELIVLWELCISWRAIF